MIRSFFVRPERPCVWHNVLACQDNGKNYQDICQVLEQNKISNETYRRETGRPAVKTRGMLSKVLFLLIAAHVSLYGVYQIGEV